MTIIKFIRWAYEFLVVLYCGLLYVARNTLSGGSWLLDTIDHSAIVLDRFGIAKFHVSVFHTNRVDLQLFHEEWFGVTLIAFACIRLLSQIKLVDRALPLVGLCLTLVS